MSCNKQLKAEGSRTRFYFLVQEGIERFGHRIHAFCLMGNHIHFVLDAIDEKRRKEFHQGGVDTRVLGDDHFLRQAMAKSSERALIDVDFGQRLCQLKSDLNQ